MTTREVDRRPTLKDVARQAGVSRSTTSRVLNDHPSVRPEVRARVRKVMHEVGYVPDGVARSLRRGRTGIIGLVIPQAPPTVFGDAYFAALVTAIVRAGQERGCTVATVLGDELGAPPDELVDRLAVGGLVDGVVTTASVDHDPLPTQLRLAGVPVVVIGTPADPAVASVDVDNAAGGRLAVEHLVAGGRRRLAVVAGPVTNASARSRREGAFQAAGRIGVRVVAEIAATEFSEDGGRAAMEQVLQRVPTPTFDGLIAGSDSIAVGAMKALQDAQVDVPGDVAVVGFDDLAPSRLASPSLTTVAQAIDDVGWTAIGLLLSAVAGGDGASDSPPRRDVLDVHLVERASTGGVAGS